MHTCMLISSFIVLVFQSHFVIVFTGVPSPRGWTS
uniref:Uncharacterized protein n=1 Tax=Nelumbo nucifera TaxID=4432 RepID=A0A822XYQ5_NELNU|nr:TPA_asm: hypothetical protein HUJ06_026307 [Nelumbo nucifera]